MPPLFLFLLVGLIYMMWNFLKYVAVFAFVLLVFAPLLAVLINFLKYRFDLQREEKEYLERQINKVYGPVNAKLIEANILYERRDAIRSILLELKKFEKEKADYDLIYLDYFKSYMCLCYEVRNIFLNNYGYIDPDDEEKAMSFVRHHTHYKMEYDENSKPKTSDELRQALAKKEGNISSWDPDLCEKIKNKLRKKQMELLKQKGSWKNLWGLIASKNCNPLQKKEDK